ncbi:tryptophan biosynthesis modulator TrpM [Streptomyces jeddahensis]|uniref:tryptophan biosynthesis modulator TrpM n=1 Tax=Streptomyces jeddahensis TaxID=1716141 RepID=UPI00098FFC49
MTRGRLAARHRTSLRSAGAAVCARPGGGGGAPRDPYARLARGCRPRGCRAPARRVHGRRVRYVIGDEPGQVNGMRWREHAARVRAGLGPAA